MNEGVKNSPLTRSPGSLKFTRILPLMGIRLRFAKLNPLKSTLFFSPRFLSSIYLPRIDQMKHARLSRTGGWVLLHRVNYYSYDKPRHIRLRTHELLSLVTRVEVRGQGRDFTRENSCVGIITQYVNYPGNTLHEKRDHGVKARDCDFCRGVVTHEK